MIDTKTSTALIVGAIVLAGGLIGGFAIQTYLAQTSPQNTPPTAESLTVRNYTPRLLTIFAVEFTLENSGTSDIQITDVKLNGFSNQTTTGMDQGWNGTSYLHPSQTGSLYVYTPCYSHIINQTMPTQSTEPTQSEIENLEAWMYSYNCTFTFVTDTAHQHNYTIPGLGFGLHYAITTWAAYSSQEHIEITNMRFTNTSILVTVNNTGICPVTINEAWVNGAKQSRTNPALPNEILANKGLVLNITTTVRTGYNYMVKLVSSKGNAVLYTVVAPG